MDFLKTAGQFQRQGTHPLTPCLRRRRPFPGLPTFPPEIILLIRRISPSLLTSYCDYRDHNRGGEVERKRGRARQREGGRVSGRDREREEGERDGGRESLRLRTQRTYRVNGKTAPLRCAFHPWILFHRAASEPFPWDTSSADTLRV